MFQIRVGASQSSITLTFNKYIQYAFIIVLFSGKDSSVMGLARQDTVAEELTLSLVWCNLSWIIFDQHKIRPNVYMFEMETLWPEMHNPVKH